MAKNCLQGLINILGIFHIRMACVDAIWQIYISLKDQQQNEGGIFDLFKLLWPKEMAKVARNPGYRMLIDGIQHLIKSNVIICWEDAVGMMDLQQWLSDEKPLWENICSLVTMIHRKYVAGADFEDMREMVDSERD